MRRSGSITTLALLLIGLFTLVPCIHSYEGTLAQTNGPIDAKELEAFFDGLVTAQLRAYHVPGATVAVVKDGQIFFAKGYGFADLEESRPVLANETLFRIASVTKLFTWTAVMQLGEQGKLDLNADVNTYLKTFQIPATYPEPITLIHLMTHTAGFDQPVGISARNAEDIRPLGEVLEDNLPARVRPPGQFSAYSNYGTALAGYIVEEVSGIPFHQYVERNILNPLKMNSTTFQQPLPPELAADMAVGYTYAKGTYHPELFQYHQLSPAVPMSTTATDMARFMIAHLQDGRYEDARILKDVTARQMHRQLFTHDPRVSGWTYGFMELNVNHQHMIWHRGSWSPQFYTLLVLLPEHNVGLFASYNSPGGGPARSALLRAFLDRYYPAPAPKVPQPPADFQLRARRFTGSYRTTTSTYTTFAKLTNLFAQVDLTAQPDGTLLMTGFGDPQPWVEVEPLVFRAAGRQPFFSRDLVFHEDDQGRITRFFLSNDPRFAFERIPWYETTTFTFGLLAACAVLFLSTMIWPISFLIHCHKGKTRPPQSLLPRLARWLMGSISALSLFFIGLLITSGIQTGPGYGVPMLVIALLVIMSLTASLVIGSTISLVLMWKGRCWSLANRVHYTMVTLAALTFIWWLNNWNLLIFQF